MNNEQTRANETVIPSITVAAYLIYKGEKFTRLHRTPGQRLAAFVFESSPTLRKHRGEWYSSEFLAFYEQVHNLKVLTNELNRSNLAPEADAKEARANEREQHERRA
jgi:Domain of unknown function (DUF5659)